jgi:hypothetical protein
VPRKSKDAFMTRRYVLAASLCVSAGALICALVAAVISAGLSAGPGEDVKARIDTQLAVQKALQEGLDQIQRGNHQAAVLALEKEIARIDGNKKYLDALATAYRGYIRDLQQQGNHAGEIELYRKRLEIIDPGSRIERPAETAVNLPAETPPAKLPAKPTPVREIKSAAAPAADPEPVKAPAVGAPAPLARGKIEDDPAADMKRKGAAEAAALVERATQEFVNKHYPEAGRYYEEAHKLDAAATGACHEQWAYCKMFVASEAIRHGPLAAGAAADLERDIRQAMAMTPKLESFGKTLLKSLQERPATGTEKTDDSATVEIRHIAAQGQGWAVVETAHFRVLHNQPKDVAEKAARVAEATRQAMSRKWFGDDGDAWSPRCDIYLYATADEYSRETKVTTRSPGHSDMTLDGGRVIARRINLHVDHPETFNSVLPHEATHVVLAGRFDGKQVPRWADEGIAVLTEPPNRVDRYLRNLSRHDQDHLLFGVGQLMRLNEYPDARQVDPFYTQSVSLVDFLSKEKGPQEFTAFLRDGLRDGYEPALRKHYKIESFADLERRWRAFALAEP